MYVRACPGAQRQVLRKQFGRHECSNMLPANIRSTHELSCANWLLMIIRRKSCISSSDVTSHSSGRNTLANLTALPSGTGSRTLMRKRDLSFCICSIACVRSPSSSAHNSRCFVRRMLARQSANGLNGCAIFSSFSTSSFSDKSKNSSIYALRLWFPSSFPQNRGCSNKTTVPAFIAQFAARNRPLPLLNAPLAAVEDLSSKLNRNDPDVADTSSFTLLNSSAGATVSRPPGSIGTTSMTDACYC
mmetsp:Transcript_49968/g.99220  ORF Transcript_49968/g.99220 Transcript_49968/m.99220 type:complete len:245 (-) Transcript_49968:36-770(-)